MIRAYASTAAPAREAVSRRRVPPPEAAGAAKTPGKPLDASERIFFGTAFREDFSGVRVHTDDRSAAAASRAGALGYTVGADIFFAAGRYAPATSAGRELLAHELTHVKQQRRGDRTHGQAEQPEAEAEASMVGREAAAGRRVAITRASPVGQARQPAGAGAAPAAPSYEYRNEQGEVVRVPEPEYEQLRAQATRQLGAAITRVSGTAEVWHKTHAEHMDQYHAESWGELWDKPQRLIGVASDIRAGVVPPPLGIWGFPEHTAANARAALNAGNLVEAARLLRLAEAHLKDAKQAWNTYIEASISGGEKLTGELEIVRDTSFAIAVGAAVIIAAPVVAAGAGAAATGVGLTGTAATVATTGGAALGTGVVGVGAGGILRGGADIAAQKVATGKVDLRKTGAEVRKHAKEDFISGASAGLAPGIGRAFGVGTKGLSLTQNVLRQGAAEATTAVLANVGGTAADTAYAIEAEGKDWRQAKEENLLPGLKQTGTAALSAGAGGALGGLARPLTGRLAAAGRPALSQAVHHGAGALAAAGTTLATGGSGKEAIGSAVQATILSAALPSSPVGSEHESGPTPAGTKPPAGEPPTHGPEHAPSSQPAPTATMEPAEHPPSEPTKKVGAKKRSAAPQSAEPPKAPRQPANQPFSSSYRRPNFRLREFAEIPPARIERHSGVRTDPDARVGIFRERFPARVATPAGATRQAYGYSFEASVAEDLIPGGGKARLTSHEADKGRIGDVGIHEATVATPLDSGKLDQLWRDLVARDQVMLTVPELPESSARTLGHMAAIFEKLTGKRPSITVRETGPFSGAQSQPSTGGQQGP